MYEYVIIGAGTTGLRKALALFEAGVEKVLIIEFDGQLGGYYSSGVAQPEAVQDLVAAAAKLPYEIWLNAMVVSLKHVEGTFELVCQTTTGAVNVTSQQVVVATGYQERARWSARLVGDRPAGDVVPAQALQLLKRKVLIGYNPLVVVNNEASLALFNQLSAIESCQPISLSEGVYDLLAVRGDKRVEEVLVRDRQTGATEDIQCDALIYSAGKKGLTHFLDDLPVIRDRDDFLVTDASGQTSVPGLLAGK